MAQLERTSHPTYCPYKGDCSYYSIPAGGERGVNAVWTYEAPYAAVSEIQEYLAFYADRVEAIHPIAGVDHDHTIHTRPHPPGSSRPRNPRRLSPFR